MILFTIKNMQSNIKSNEILVESPCFPNRLYVKNIKDTFIHFCTIQELGINIFINNFTDKMIYKFY